MKRIHLFTLLLPLLSIILFSCSNNKAKVVRCQEDMEGARIGVVAGSVNDIIVTEDYDEKLRFFLKKISVTLSLCHSFWLYADFD